MSGIKKEQLDLLDLSKYFATRNYVERNIETIGKSFIITGDGNTKEYTLDHDSNNVDVDVTIIDLSTNEIVFTDIKIIDSNHITLSFYENLAITEKYKVLVTSKSTSTVQ